MAMPSNGLVLCMLLSPPLPLLSWVSLWSQAKHQNLPFKRTWSAFHFPSAAWGATTSASYMKKKNVFLPKNNLGFKCPLQRGWNNLSWTLRRQKKVIAWVSHYLQQGRQARSHFQSGIGITEYFLLMALWEKRPGCRQALRSHSHPFLDYEHWPHQCILLEVL